MRQRYRVLKKSIPFIVLVSFLFGTQSLRADDKAPATSTSALTIAQFMDWVIDPAADVVWESVGWISDEKGDREIIPKTDEQWNTVRNSAATLMEAAMLLTVEPKVRDKGQWTKSALRLSRIAQRAMIAAQSKDAQALFEAGSDLEEACESCHIVYAYPPEKAEAWPPKFGAAPEVFKTLAQHTAQ